MLQACKWSCKSYTCRILVVGLGTIVTYWWGCGTTLVPCRVSHARSLIFLVKPSMKTSSKKTALLFVKTFWILCWIEVICTGFFSITPKIHISLFEIPAYLGFSFAHVLDNPISLGGYDDIRIAPKPQIIRCDTHCFAGYLIQSICCSL